MFWAGESLRGVRKQQLPGQEVGQAMAAGLQAITQEIGLLPIGKSAVQDFGPAGVRQGSDYWQKTVAVGERALAWASYAWMARVTSGC